MDVQEEITRRSNPGKEEKKKQGKEYEKYAKKFSTKPKYFSNCVKAFIFGGLICEIGYVIQTLLMSNGMNEKDAGSWVTVILICAAQLLTGFGVYDTFAKIAGAGSMVPITGFANAMVSAAIEYKKEGPVLGVGSKIFSIAGPVLACGMSASVVVGLIYYIIDKVGG